MMEHNDSQRDEFVSKLKLCIVQDAILTFDMDNDEHHDQLKQWCTDNWNPLIVSAKEKKQRITFHECCFCFTRKTFTPSAGHSPDVSFTFYPGVYSQTIKNPTELYAWLIKSMEQHKTQSIPLIFPRINVTHHRRHLLDSLEGHEEVDLLGKRVSELDNEIAKLRRNNSKLQGSASFWYDKYCSLDDIVRSGILTMHRARGPVIPSISHRSPQTHMSSEEDLT